MLLGATAPQMARYAELARRRYRSYSALLGRSTFSMLDVGCGAGEIGSEFLDLGVDYHGLNIDARIIDLGSRRLGDRIRNQDFLRAAMDRQYDMVCFHQVLEHITDPTLFAKRVSNCCGDGGGIHGDVPNMAGLSALVHRLVPLNKHRFGAVMLPHHQFAYEAKTIHRLFGQEFKLDTFNVRIDDPTWGQINELGPVMQSYSALSGVLNAGTNLAFIGKRIDR